MTNDITLTITEGQFNFFQTLKIVASHLAIEETEQCPAVIYHGMVQYLTHAERVRIIQGSGADYDVVPKDFDGPLTKDKTDFNFLEYWRDCPYHIATEWDGTLSVIYAEAVPNSYAYGGEMFVLYQDGVYNRMSMADFRQLIGLPVSALCYGYPTNPVEIVMRAMWSAVDRCSGESGDPCTHCNHTDQCHECSIELGGDAGLIPF